VELIVGGHDNWIPKLIRLEERRCIAVHRAKTSSVEKEARDVQKKRTRNRLHPLRPQTHVTETSGEVQEAAGEEEGSLTTQKGEQNMKNLAGVQECDKDIRKELTEAGIRMVAVPKGNTEVPFSVIGQLSYFTFRRAWYYWVVEGDVPLAVAQEMYATEVGKRDVRVVGHCGCPPPEEWAIGGFVRAYHIDSQEGLKLFADTIRKHGLM